MKIEKSNKSAIEKIKEMIADYQETDGIIFVRIRKSEKPEFVLDCFDKYRTIGLLEDLKLNILTYVK